MLSHERFMRDCTAIREKGGRLVALQAERQPSGEVQLSYCFEVAGRFKDLLVASVGQIVPSLFSTFPNADFPERQAAEQYQVKFLGHPNLRIEGAEP